METNLSIEKVLEFIQSGQMSPEEGAAFYAQWQAQQQGGSSDTVGPEVAEQRPGSEPAVKQAYEKVEPVQAEIDDKQILERTESFLTQAISEEIKRPVADILPNEPMERYGLDSVMIMQVTRNLERVFGELSKTLFFEYQTVGALADYFVEQYRDVLLKHLFAGRHSHVPTSTEAGTHSEAMRLSRPLEQARTTRNAEVPAPVAPSPPPGPLNDEPFAAQPRRDKPIARSGRRARSVEPSVESLERDKPDAQAIAIIGLSGRYPMAPDLERFWENLKAGRDCITEIPADRWDWRTYYDSERAKQGKSYSRWGGFIDDVDKFDPLFFNISPMDAEGMDPQERILLQTVWHTLEDAGYPPESLSGSQVGVFVGVMSSEYQLYGAQDALRGTVPAIAGSFATIANRVSYVCNFQGPSVALDTMCSSSLTAIHMACESIRTGEVDVAVAGGVNVTIHPNKYIFLGQERFVSSDGRCRSFGEGGDGYVPGEGVGAVLLKPLSRAVADGDHIYGVIKATAINHGGKTNGYYVPNPIAQAKVIARALKKSGVDPRTIGYVEGHGTGTFLGDPIEMTGLVRAFGGDGLDKQSCPIGSVKSNIGHLEAAAGIAAVTKVLLQLKHRQLVPSLHSGSPNPHIHFTETPFYLQHELADWRQPVLNVNGEQVAGPRRAAISSFGAGGSNAHIILEEYQESPTHSPELPQVFLLSARNGERLSQYVESMIRFLESNAPSLTGLAYTLQVGRAAMEERLAVVASDQHELLRHLKAWVKGDADVVPDRVFAGNARKTKGVPDLLKGEEGERLLSGLSESRGLERLASLWVTGAPIEWQRLHELAGVRRISLPVYPFAKERYWVAQVQTPQGAVQHVASLHPLLDVNVSTLERQAYQKRFRKDDPYLREHVVGGRSLLPGAVMVELMRTAAALSHPQGWVSSLSEVVWHRPVTSVGDETLLTVSLTAVDSRIACEVTSEVDGERVLHAQAFLTCSPPDALPEMLDLRAIRERCGVVLEQAECYESFAAAQFEYGPSFRVLRRVFKGQAEALAQIALPALVKSADDYVLHPLLLDGVLQAIIGTVDDSQPDLVYLPYAVGEIQVLKALTAECWVHVVALQTAPSQHRTFQICVTDDVGEVLVRLTKVMVGATRQESGSRSVLYRRPVWEPAAESGPMASAVDGAVLLFDRDERLARAMRERGLLVTLVRPGASFENVGDLFTLQPTNLDHYRKLFAALKSGQLMPRAVVHNWAATNGDLTESAIRAELEGGLLALLPLTRALLEQRLVSPTPLIFLHPDQPHHTAVAGFARAVRMEQPNLLGKTVALDGLESAQVVDAVLREVGLTADVEVRLAPSGRWVRRMAEPTANADVHGSPYRDEGVYLITGGAGGLGFIFAADLARRFRARLVLTGRSGLSTEISKKLQALQDLGAEAVYVQADVSRRDDVKRLVAEAKTRFGHLHGVIHSAGLLRDGLLLHKSPEEMAQVLAPKVFGTLYLDEETSGESLDFFVAFSSTSAIFGNVGQADYAAANRFMDAFAEYRAQQVRKGLRQGRTLSVNWPLWKDGGMQVSANVLEHLSRVAGLTPLETGAGIRALERALLSDDVQRVVIAGDAVRVQALLDQSGLSGSSPVIAPQVSSASETSALEQAVSTADSVSADGRTSDESRLKELAIQYLKSLFAPRLKLLPGRLIADDPLEKYGVDSVLIVDLTQELEQVFGPLSKTLFFEYQSIAELADYLVARHSQRFKEKVGFTSPATPSRSAKPVAASQAQEPAARRERFLSVSAQPLQDRSARTPDSDDIAVIGLAGRYPKARNLVEFWENLKAGRDCITEVPSDRWPSAESARPDEKRAGKWGGFIDEVDKFDPFFFNILPVEAQIMDPQERIFLETAWQTIEDAGYTRARLSREQVGVFVGVMYGHYQLFGAEQTVMGNPIALGSSFASIANRVSYFLNLNGPSIALDTMCSSSLTAIHLACASIRRGETDLAIAGGVNLSIHPAKYQLLNVGGFLSSDGRCRSFGEGGDGYVPGEGAGAVLLKPLSKALADGDQIYGVIKATAVNHGGKTNGYTVPNPKAQGNLIADTLRKANLDPRTISYIEAHGTGTALGDPIEITGLVQAFDSDVAGPKQYCSIGSVKSNIGHLESAAGIAALTKVLLQMKHNQLVPSLHAERLNTNVALADTPFYVQRELSEWRQPVMEEAGVRRTAPRRAGISSFGAGGANAHIIVEQYQRAAEPISTDDQPELILLSARNGERLKEYARELAVFVDRAIRPAGLPAAELQRDSSLVTPGIRKSLERLLLDKVAELTNINPAEVTLSDPLQEFGLHRVHYQQLADLMNEALNLALAVPPVQTCDSVEALVDYWFEHVSQPGASHQLPATSGTGEAAHSLADLAYTLQIGREPMEERLVIVASSLQELTVRLQQYCDGGPGEGVYTGNAKQAQVASLFTGEDGQAYLARLLQGRKFEALAKLWVSGFDIDWTPGHQPARHCRISLPTYPFASERMWFKAAVSDAQEGRGGRTAWLHPLVERNLSTFREQRFASRFSTSDPYVTLEGAEPKQLLGAPLVEMARAAGEISAGRPVRVIQNLRWAEPLNLTGATCNLVVDLFENEQTIDFEVRTQPEGPILMTGQAVPDRLSDLKPVMTPSRLNHLRTRLEPCGDNAPQAVREVFVGDAEALARLDLPTSFRGGAGQFLLHPVLLEAAVGVAALEGHVQNRRAERLVPVSAERVEVTAALAEAGLVHVHRNKSGDWDVQFMTEHGEVVALILGWKLAPYRTDESPAVNLHPTELQDMLRRLEAGELKADEVKKTMGALR